MMKQKMDNIVGDNNQNQHRDKKLDVLKPTGSQFNHLRIRSGDINLPNSGFMDKMGKHPDDEETIVDKKNTIMIISPSEDKTAEIFINAKIDKGIFGKKGFYKP